MLKQFLEAAGVVIFTTLTLSATTHAWTESAVTPETQGSAAAMTTDSFSYLEDLDGARASAWVQGQNKRTLARLERDPRFRRFYDAAIESETAVSEADGRGLLPAPGRMWLDGEWVYEIFTDSTHPRGVWRRALLQSFLRHAPQWQLLLDMDALSAAERQDWTFVQSVFSPNGARCLLQLAPGGSLRSAWREFDIERRAFVPEGFQLPGHKVGQLAWRDDDSVLVATDFGPGTVTATGAPVTVREWARGKPLAQAREIFRGSHDGLGVSLNPMDDVGSRPGAHRARHYKRLLHIGESNRTGEMSWWRLTGDDRLERIAVPLPRSVPMLYADHYVLALTADWLVGGTTWKRGQVIAIPAAQVTQASPIIHTVLEVDENTVANFVGARTRNGLLILGSKLGDSRLWRTTYRNGKWTTARVPLADHGIVLPAASAAHSDVAFVRYESFLHPPALYQLDADGVPTLFASALEQFDSEAFLVEQFEAKSADGMLVPYSVVRPRSFRFAGDAPTLVIAYGAYGATYPPSYSATVGKLWLEQGGVYVVANVRGGRERGPAWYVTGVDRQHTYDDLVAVTEDLISRRFTNSRKLGFMGHSAGGLLGGVMLTQHPDLFRAVILKAPVLDLFRMNLLAGGAALRAREYGSVDVPAERAFLERTSPFQNLKARPGLPTPLLIASSTDANVSAAHPRRFAARMESLGMPFLYYETGDGGHGLAATLPQKVRLDALIFTYLAQQLCDEPVETN